jgi:omega-hydroxy-beta-dihydromenaquinone-9 sulfotransferase
MYFNYPDFLKALRLSLLQKPFRIRRWFYVLFFNALFLSFIILMALLRWLDTLFFPDFRKIEVHQPVFIIAPPRSGTTFLQNVLCQDEERFIYWKMYQTIFPSICFQKLLDALVWFDHKLGNLFSRLLNWCEVKWFGEWDKLHRMRLDQPEEDGAIYLYAFANEAIYLLFPFVKELWNLGFQDNLPDPKRQKLMAYYRSCLQRQIYANGNGRAMLIKSTQTCGAVESLKKEFPDARFITIMRHPFEAIASNLSLTVPVWQAHSPEITKDGTESLAYAELQVEWYKYLFHFRSHVSLNNYFCIDYRDLRDDPVRTIESLYGHFGWAMSEIFQARLSNIGARNKNYQSSHQYTLEEFGLSRQTLEKELAAILETYNL